jgi:hypothetical protein
MQEEVPYKPLAVLGPDGSATDQADLPMPEMQFARPLGAWVIVGALFVVVVGLWAMVATYFSIHA